MFSSNTSQTSGGYEIQRSLRFNSADSAYLNRTPASASNRRTFTFSAWVKRSALGTDQDFFGVRIDGDNQFRFYCNTSNKIDIYNQTVGSLNARLITTQVFRDVSAWYHFVVAIDTTNATAGDRMRLYVNNVEVTAFDTDTQPTQNLDTQVDTVNSHTIGYFGVATGNNYMTEVNFIDGQQLTPSSFGAFDAQTGVWGPTPYAGSYGTNGFYLNFSDNSNTTAATLGKDYSGNGNNWTPNNFSVSAGAGNDSLVDVPTNWGTDTGVGGSVRGNYCTLNPLDRNTNLSITNGNLNTTATGGSGWASVRAGIFVSSGKWYWEVYQTYSSGLPWMIGIADLAFNPTTQRIGDTAGSYTLYAGGSKGNNGSFSSYAGASIASGRTIGVALDLDAGTLTFYDNGTSLGTAFTGISGTFAPALSIFVTDNTIFDCNFGQRPFAYTAPSGFKALNTQNLPTPTIGATTATQAGKFFNPVLYTGNSGVNVVTGMGFQPDMLWQKDRTSTGNNAVNDAVRGINNVLLTNLDLAELTGTTYLTSLDSDGFSMNTASPAFNFTGRSYVAWGWKANGAGVTNTAGSITSTVSANTTSGFSVVRWTHPSLSTQTIGHGLGVAPKMIIVKSRTSTESWAVYHASLGATKALLLNGTDAAITSSAFWNDTAPTSTVFSKFNGAVDLVAYCFAEIPGYSRFGSYVGNNSADGPFVFCGFRPAYLLVKRTDTSGYNWIVYDTTRDTYNVAGKELLPNTADAEGTYPILDFLSNGFKIRISATSVNASGGTYIFAAFASAPQKFALAR